jgi:hypothetical protein
MGYVSPKSTGMALNESGGKQLAKHAINFRNTDSPALGHSVEGKARVLVV